MQLAVQKSKVKDPLPIAKPNNPTAHQQLLTDYEVFKESERATKSMTHTLVAIEREQSPPLDEACIPRDH